ncbi:MAG: CdaR family protein [Peptostreptococcaceae bacterium]
MREKLKNNTKIKLIALLSAVVLWMYVMAVVDPEETKLFEDVPVTITNLDDLIDKDLVVYPETEITTNVYVTGKLSNIQKINKDDINVYGEIKQPIEGKNEIYLKTTPSQRVTYEFKNSVAIINLEKVIEENKSIDVIIDGNSKGNVDSVELENVKDGINVSGPRSLVQEVDKIVAELSVQDQVDDFNTTLELKPVDKKGNVVSGVDLEITSVNAKVVLLKEKTVPIKINYTDENADNISLSDYKLSQDTVLIKGKKETVDKIEFISTQAVNLLDIAQSTTKDVNLEIPEGITSETKYITIKLNTVSKVNSEFTYKSSEVEIRNNTNNIDTSTIKIPEVVTISIEYNNDIGKVEKENITLYIDLAEVNSTSGKYEIKYESDYDIKSVVINPSTTEE